MLDFQTEKKKASNRKAKTSEDSSEEEQQALPAGLERGQAQEVQDAEAIRKKIRAPKRFTEATLLTAMETAGKTLDEKELSDAMKESGLGTPATRASIIEVLLKREYIVRNGKNLEATDKGLHLIEVVHPEVKSPAMTGQWEAYLQRIQRGEAQLEPFLEARWGPSRSKGVSRPAEDAYDVEMLQMLSERHSRAVMCRPLCLACVIVKGRNTKPPRNSALFSKDLGRSS